jgi:hypothetical protein
MLLNFALFDIFKKLPDGTMVWQTFVSGELEAECKLRELNGRSNGAEFLAIDIQSGKPLPMIGPRKSQLAIKKAANG